MPLRAVMFAAIALVLVVSRPSPARGEDSASRSPAGAPDRPPVPAALTDTAAGDESSGKDAVEDADDPVLVDLRGAGENGEKSTLAAQTLLQTILAGKEPKASQYRRFLRLVLDPANLTRNPRDIPVAEKLLASMGYMASGDAAATTPAGVAATLGADGSERVLSIVGIGPASLRRAVRDTLVNFIRGERRQGGASATMKALAARLQTNAPPPPEVVTEISSVLLEVDPRALIGFLIAGMARNTGTGDGSGDGSGETVYVLELRRLLLLDLPSAREWQEWWKENRAKSFPVIAAEARARFDARRVQLWQRTFQRIREGGSPERYLGVLADTFSLDFTPRMRVAVLGALGAFPEWLRDTRGSEGAGGGGTLGADARAELLRRAATMALDILADGPAHRISPQVRVAALQALGEFAAFLVHEPELEKRAAGVLVADLRAVLGAAGEAGRDPAGDPAGGGDAGHVPARARSVRNRSLALALVRTAGALRLADPQIRAVLKKALAADLAGDARDVDLLIEMVTALGRILERTGDLEIVDLVADLYRRVRQAPEAEKKAYRELRKACITALGVPLEDPTRRDRVRALYVEVLSPEGEKQARIPALIGLGILARAGDDASAEALKGVLARRDQFDSSEVVAAVDALAYLGGKKALSCFVGFLDAKDKPFSDQVWQKVASILKGGDQAVYAWLVEELERQGFEKDPAENAAVIIRLAGEPVVGELFSAGKLDLADRTAFLRFWKWSRILIDALEIAGKEKEAIEHVDAIAELVAKNEAVRKHRHGIEKEILDLRTRLEEMIALRADLAGAGTADATRLRERVRRILDLTGRDPGSRWRTLNWLVAELRGLAPSEENQRLADAVTKALTDSDSAPIWEGIPENLRERFRKSLPVKLVPGAEGGPRGS